MLAQGGYGRGELNPQSDIDLLFLYPWKVNPYVETVAEVMLYALWDAGLQVGHAVRNVRECGRLAARDLKVKTALLDARYLCGDEPLYDEFDDVVLEEIWSQSQTGFFKEKLNESEERHARAGDSVYLLQPQLKEGQGGLRDLHTALWMAKVKFKVRTFRELVALGVLTEARHRRAGAARRFPLAGAQRACTSTTDTHQDQLTFELQERLAPALGFGPGRPGVEAFMRTYYRHATTVQPLRRGGDRALRAGGAGPTTGRRRACARSAEGMRIQGTHALRHRARGVRARSRRAWSRCSPRRSGTARRSRHRHARADPREPRPAGGRATTRREVAAAFLARAARPRARLRDACSRCTSSAC